MRANGLKTIFSQPLCTCQYGTLPRWSVRKAFYSTIFSPQPDQVQLKVGSNGSISLEYVNWYGLLHPANRYSIYHAPQSPKSNNPVVIYLPRGPVSPTESTEPIGLLSLAAAANTTVVRLNYRLSKDHRYPYPVHDVLAGYDWVVQHLLQTIPARADHNEMNKIAVCGEFIGGSLAAALGLTECHKNKTGVRTMVLGNPISDWTSMYTVAKSEGDLLVQETKTGRKKRTPKLPAWEAFAHSSELSTSALLRARGNLFRLQEDYFDVFASPMLFFRTPAIDVPPEVNRLDELFSKPNNMVQTPAKKRKSHRRFPPVDSELLLPYTKVLVGESCLLKDQGIELAEGIARSNHSYGGPMGVGQGTGWETVEVELRKGIGAWKENDLAEIGYFIRESFKD